MRKRLAPFGPNLSVGSHYVGHRQSDQALIGQMLFLESLMSSAPIVAIALLTQEDLKTLGGSFLRAYPIDKIHGFEDLVRQLDQVESRLTESQSIART